jgi:hypothetical protein
MKRIRWTPAVLLGAALLALSGAALFSGCSDDNPTSSGSDRTGTLLVSAVGEGSESVIAGGAPHVISNVLAGRSGFALDGPIDSITVTKAEISIGGIALKHERPDSTEADTTDAEDDEEEGEEAPAAFFVLADSAGGDSSASAWDRFRGPFIVDISSGQAAALAVGEVPVGDYEAILVKIHRIGPPDVAAHPEWADRLGASLWIEGYVNGDDSPDGRFAIALNLNAAYRIPGDFTVEEGFNPAVLLSFDFSEWFDGPGGLLDPRDGRHVTENRIRVNVLHSLKGGKDHNGNGHVDEGEAD